MRFLSDRCYYLFLDFVHTCGTSFFLTIFFWVRNWSCVGKDKTDFYDDIPVIIRELIQRFNDENLEVVKAASKAFSALSKYVPAEELAKHIEYMRNLINSMVSDARRRKGGVGDGEFFLPGFNIPKGEFGPPRVLAGTCEMRNVFYDDIDNLLVGFQ
jgi:hypothetical protein